MTDSQNCTTDTKLDIIMSANTNLGKEIRHEMKQQTENIEQKLSCIIDKNKMIEEKQGHLENKIKYLEKSMKRKNIVIYNIKETEKNNEELQNLVLYLLNNILDIKTSIFEIDFIRRIGKYNEKKNRPLLLGLTTQIKKDTIMKNKSKLKFYKDEIIYIRDDYTKEDMKRTIQEKITLTRAIETEEPGPSVSKSKTPNEKTPQQLKKRSRPNEKEFNINDGPEGTTLSKKPKNYMETERNDKRSSDNTIHKFFQNMQRDATVSKKDYDKQ